MRFEFEAEVWQWNARQDSAWFFVSVPEELSADIREVPRLPRGFGAVRVRARIGGSEWTTSVFPESTTGQYSLPLKKSVRVAEGLELGAVAGVRIDLLDQ